MVGGPRDALGHAGQVQGGRLRGGVRVGVPIDDEAEPPGMALGDLGPLLLAIRGVARPGALVAAPQPCRLDDLDPPALDPGEKLAARLPPPPAGLPLLNLPDDGL